MNIPLFISRTNVAKQTRGKGNDESRSFFCTITERIFRLFVILCSLFAKRAEILILFLKKSIAFWEKTWYNNHRQRGGLRFVAWHGGIAQLVRAFAWRAKGPEFESLYLHHNENPWFFKGFCFCWSQIGHIFWKTIKSKELGKGFLLSMSRNGILWFSRAMQKNGTYEITQLFWEDTLLEKCTVKSCIIGFAAKCIRFCLILQSAKLALFMTVRWAWRGCFEQTLFFIQIGQGNCCMGRAMLIQPRKSCINIFANAFGYGCSM